MAVISIVIEDNAITKDGQGYGSLDFSQIAIPDSVWALQWNGNSGHIEFENNADNEDITELPAWALACLDQWQEASDNDKSNLTENYDGVEDSLWNLFPDADVNAAQKVADINLEGSRVYVCNQEFSDGGRPVGLHFGWIKPGNVGLKSINTYVAEAEKYGLPCFSDRQLDWEQKANFITWLQNNGWEIWTGNNGIQDYKIYYRPWTLALAKARKKTIINTERNTSINNGYNDGTNTWDIDTQSMSLMTAKTVGLADDGSVTWRTKTNTNVTMTGAEFKTLVENADAAVEVIYQNSWTRKANVDAATTEDEVNAA